MNFRAGVSCSMDMELENLHVFESRTLLPIDFSADNQRQYNLLLKLQSKIIDALVEGVPCGDVYMECKSWFESQNPTNIAINGMDYGCASGLRTFYKSLQIRAGNQARIENYMAFVILLNARIGEVRIVLADTVLVLPAENGGSKYFYFSTPYISVLFLFSSSHIRKFGFDNISKRCRIDDGFIC